MNIERIFDKKKNRITLQTLNSQKQLIFMSVPILLYIVLFNYAPIWGWLMAFQDYNPSKNFFHQTWVGLKNFKFLVSDDNFFKMLRNTLAMSLINIVLGFVTAITLALLLNEIRAKHFKSTVQTISYLPHFLSWVVVAGIVQAALSIEDGIVNNVLLKLKVIDSPLFWLGEPGYFWGIIGVTNVWKEIGWNTIIYLAAISSIDPALYEAADIDGASRYQRMWHITLPGIKPIIYILLILAVGHILDVGFELPYLLRNGLVSDYSDTIDIFVILYAFKEGNFALATATGIFKSIVNIVLLLSANTIARKLGEESLV